LYGWTLTEDEKMGVDIAGVDNVCRARLLFRVDASNADTIRPAWSTHGAVADKVVKTTNVGQCPT